MGELLADLAVDLIPGQMERHRREVTSEEKFFPPTLALPPSRRWDMHAFLSYLPKTIQEETE